MRLRAASSAAYDSSTERSSSSWRARGGLEPADVGAAAGHDLDQPGALERTQRLANRIAGDAELLGEPILEQPLAGRQIAGDDHLPDLVGDDLAQGAV